MSQAPPPCLYCGGPGTIIYPALRDVQQGVPGIWKYRWCRTCEVAWLDPRPAPAEIPALYAPEGYVTHADYAWPPSACVNALRRLRKAGRVVDVGCGNGTDLAKLRDAGWKAIGLEPDPAAAALARRLSGVEIIQATLEHAALPDQAFDAVLLNHTIEHLGDPVATLREARRVLKPGGLLIAATPNWRSAAHRHFGADWYALDVPRHLFLWTAPSLRRLVEMAGFTTERVRTTGNWAGSIYLQSWLLRRRGRLPPGAASACSVMDMTMMAACSGAVSMAERVACHFRDVGEEIELVARS